MSDLGPLYTTSDEDVNSSERNPPRRLCTEWREFFDFVDKHHESSNGDEGSHGKNKSIPDYEEILKDIPHCSVGGWRTLVRSPPDQPFTQPVNLPNSIDDTDVDVAKHINKNFVEVNPAVLNAILFYQDDERELDVVRTQRATISSMKDFISKICKALDSEKEFKDTVKKDLIKKQRSSSTSSKSDKSQMNDSELSSDEHVPVSRRLQKLGKVYAELKSCMKACSEAQGKWIQSAPSAVLRSQSLQESCLDWQGSMLLHVRWLIEARLLNLGCLVTSQFNDDDFDSDEVFYTSESKRFSKLIELYNEYVMQHLKETGVTEKELDILFGDLAQTNITALSESLNKTYIDGMGETPSTLRAGVLFPLSVIRMLHILSESFTKEIGPQVVKILSSCKATQLFKPSRASEPPRKAVESGFLWEDASRIDVRPIKPKNHKSSFFRVIKRVAGINVPDINMDEAGKQCSVLAKWFEMHKKVISSFVAGLGGKTEILRRSRNFQDPYLSDDTVSVSSSVSRTSSSLARYNEVKTVSWKDACNHEAMKSITSNYIEFLTSSLPEFFRRTQQVNFDEAAEPLEIFSFQNDIDLIVLQAVVSNLGHLNVMPDNLHAALFNTSTETLINAALGCSDMLVCNMLGKTTPDFDKPSIQKEPGSALSLATHLCVASLQPLMHLMEFYSQNDMVAKDVINRVEIILNGGFGWIRKKIQEFVSGGDLPALLEMSLSDLRELTNVALDCLRLVETCHNHIETRRNQDAATLHLATKYLHNIDALITNMQMESGSSMAHLGKEAKCITSKILVSHFPPQKFWLQKNSIDIEKENKYVHAIIEAVLKNTCTAVRKMDFQSQLAGMTPVVNSVFETCLEHIAKSKMKFTVQGAIQLSYDFSSIINFVTDEGSGLSEETRDALSSLHSPKCAMQVTQLLQSTAHIDDIVPDERFRPQSVSISSSSLGTPDLDHRDGEFNDKFWLSLRKHNMRRSKTWTSLLPCMDEK